MGKQLQEPILEGGIANTHYFNGRVLTAEALRKDQLANRLQHQQLGRAVGQGVVTGFDVRLVHAGDAATLPSVLITRGLGLNEKGQALALAADVEVALVREQQPVPPEAGLFAECRDAGPPGPAAELTAAGAYLLVVTPASGFRDKAPLVGSIPSGAPAGCGSRDAVEGVKFQLLRLSVPDNLGPAERRRNLLAHLCLGTERLLGFPHAPFAPDAPYGGLDGLRQAGTLTDGDLPLALISWGGQSVEFLDPWAARRRLAQPPATPLWPFHLGQRRLAEAEATFLQFQEHLEALRQDPGRANLVATTRFRYLPPAGYVPVGAQGFNPANFFKGLTVQEDELDGAFLRLLFEQAWFLEPIDLDAPPALRLYRVEEDPEYRVFIREERRPAPQPEPGPQPQPQPGGQPAKGHILIYISGPEDPKILVKTGKDFQVGIDIKVWAEDKVHNKYWAELFDRRTRIKFGKEKRMRIDTGDVGFAIRDLPAGRYTVHVEAKGFLPAQRIVQVSAGTVSVSFTLTEARPSYEGPMIRPGPGKGEGLDPPYYEKIDVLDKYPPRPWPPEDWKGGIPVVDPPPEMKDWLIRWAAYMQGRHPGAAIDPAGTTLYIDPAHTPASVPEGPYAYLVFGEQGTYVPVLLTPTDQTLRVPVSPAKAGVAGIDEDAQERLRAHGLGELDALGASWTGLVAEALGVSASTATSIIQEGRGKIGQLSNSLEQFSGVDQGLIDALGGEGFQITTPADLANADPERLVRELGLTPGFARRLVDDARKAVGREAWALSGPQLGLKEEEAAALEARGITSLGLLQGRRDEAVAALESAGMSRESAEATVGGIDLGQVKTRVERERAGAAPVTSLAGINREVAGNLARLKVARLADLAAADPNVVAAAFGGDVGRATEVIRAAADRVGGNR